ncbi:MAG: hypothetical protein Q7R43_04570 [Candidatus Daviesbacteria bacterium]|nr:hypothetical protein [Candidatus Daviesbacteria bacterium]
MQPELDQNILEIYQNWKSLKERETELQVRISELKKPIDDWESRVAEKHLFSTIVLSVLRIGYPQEAQNILNAVYEQDWGLHAEISQCYADLSELIINCPGTYPLVRIISWPSKKSFTYEYECVVKEDEFVISYTSNSIFARRSLDLNATVLIEPTKPPLLILPERCRMLAKTRWPYFHNLTHSLYSYWQPTLGNEAQLITPDGDIKREWKEEIGDALTYTDFVLVKDFQCQKPSVFIKNQ